MTGTNNGLPASTPVRITRVAASPCAASSCTRKRTRTLVSRAATLSAPGVHLFDRDSLLLRRLQGALKIEHLGPQNQRFGYEEFSEQFRQQFGYALR